ncbi:MAG: VanW family protein, partial [Actinomycetota bacterium]
EHAAGPADASFRYGRASDTTLVGDWDADGRTTVAVRRGRTSYLRNSNSGGDADVVFDYGRDDDEVVVGDWDGDGVETLGVRRGGTFYLRNSNSGGDADVVFDYGRDDDRALSGDWNDSGAASVGVRREARFLLRMTNDGGPADLDYRYGRPFEPEPEPEPEPDPEPVAQVVSSFTTPLVPGQDRNINIGLAADYIDGDVIGPGDTYSLNQGIGQRTRARGFVEDGFIDDDGQLISVVGGGVSQMGTTFVNAAWFSGIQLDEFRQHSIYFERYPMCREATLAWEVLDVVVTNDSPHPITIVTDHSSESVTVSFVSLPWAEVDSRIGQPYAYRGASFRVDCGRTITYPDGTTTNEDYSWRYDRAG